MCLYTLALRICDIAILNTRMSKSILFAFDFDWTLIDVNVDQWFIDLADTGKSFQEVVLFVGQITCSRCLQ